MLAVRFVTGTTCRPAASIILTLFNASGEFIDDNDEGAGVATDPTTGLAADARLTDTLTPGNYIVALTEFDNFSIGNLADGFAETGNPNFTADPSFTSGGACPGNMFRDISGSDGAAAPGTGLSILSTSRVPRLRRQCPNRRRYS